MKAGRQKQGIDIVSEVLESCLLAYPVSSFLISLYKQYRERGFLTKKQLQGLYNKAAGTEGFPPGKLATLQALINRMKTRQPDEKPVATPLYEKDPGVEELLSQILQAFPAHKRALFLQSKYLNQQPLSATEKKELETFAALARKRLQP